MKKLNSILSIISLCITSFLLVLLVFAWYATNKVANVNDGVGSVAAQPGLVAKVDYYSFSEKSSTTYTVGGHTNTPSPSKLVMNAYSFSEDAAPTIYYIRIQLQENVSISQVRFISSATHFVGFAPRNYTAPDDNEQTQTYDCDDSNGVLEVDNRELSLSSVIKFAYLGTTNSANTYVNQNNLSATFNSLSGLTWQNFEYNQTSGVITKSSVNLLTNSIESSNSPQYIHLLLDYDISHLNEFYGNNLANQTILNYHEGPEFTNTDFTIYLLG